MPKGRTKKMKERVFEVLCEDTEISVKVGEDGKISHISVSEMEMQPVWTSVSGNPHSEENILNVDYAFELMMVTDIESFKNMLKEIKNSEPNYYEKGVALLQYKKEQLIKEAEETYSL